MTQSNLAANIEATLSLLEVSTAQPLSAQDPRYMLAFNMVVPPAIRASIPRSGDFLHTLG